MGGRQSRKRNDSDFHFQAEENRRTLEVRNAESMIRAVPIIVSPKPVEEKCYDPLDNTLTFVDEEDHLDFLCEGFKSKRAAMSCGHAVTPMSLTKWCRQQLDQGKSKFVCGQPGCDAKWPYKEVCKMALLTSEERRYFLTKLDSNAAKNNPDLKQCPGCKSYVRRTDPNNLSVECPMCTAQKGTSSRFCWQCLKEWSGPAPRSDHCDNEDCVSPLEILKNCPDIIFDRVKGVTGCPSVRACPTCGLLVEHDKTLCKHVTCRRCKVKFCFVCLKLFAFRATLSEDTDRSNVCSSDIYGLCTTGVVPRQTSIPVWNKK
ncbi:uncharacterized protein V6R79_014468 [Siganus canaliculatus]